jgi:hypothetical protein
MNSKSRIFSNINGLALVIMLIVVLSTCSTKMSQGSPYEHCISTDTAQIKLIFGQKSIKQPYIIIGRLYSTEDNGYSLMGYHYFSKEKFIDAVKTKASQFGGEAIIVEKTKNQQSVFDIIRFETALKENKSCYPDN